MTKEEILEKHRKEYREENRLIIITDYDAAMDEYLELKTTSLKAEVESLQSKVRQYDETVNRMAARMQEMFKEEKEQLAKAEADKKELFDINFWKRLNIFISNVQVNDMMSEEEKTMIINIANKHDL